MALKPVNFERVIRASGLSKREIAAQKRIKPETLSRHISGTIRMTLDDAHEYAEILDCDPQEVFFPLEEIPVLIKTHLQNDIENERFGTSFVRTAKKEPFDIVYAPSHFGKGLAACVFEADDDFNGQLMSMPGAVDVVMGDAILEERVLSASHQKMSYVCLKNPDDLGVGMETTPIMIMTVFPQPNNKFTLFNQYTGNRLDDVELQWATPICAHVPMPEVFFVKQ